MARDDLHFRLRIPEDLKARIENAASINERSMTAEIIARLQWTFGPAEEQMKGLLAETERAETRAREALRTVSELSHSLRTREQEVAALERDNAMLREEFDELRTIIAGQEGAIEELRDLARMFADQILKAAEAGRIDLGKVFSETMSERISRDTGEKE